MDLHFGLYHSVREGSPDVCGPAPNIDIYDDVNAHANGAGVEGNTAFERVQSWRLSLISLFYFFAEFNLQTNIQDYAEDIETER